MRRLLLLAALVFPAAAAHAQIFSVYGTFSPVQISNIPNSSTTTTSYWAQGFGGGVTFGILPIGPIHIGLDLRGSSKPGANGADTVLAGLRVGVKPPLIRIKPYIQASGGYLGPRPLLVNSPLPAGTVSHDEYAMWEILGGIDYPLLRILDLRVIEVGGGKGYDVSGATSTNVPNISILTVNTGLVLHF